MVDRPRSVHHVSVTNQGRTIITTDTAPSATEAPRLAAGTELLGEYRGSGFTEPRYLIRRDDGQVAQLPHLLYVLASRIDGHRDTAALAHDVGAEVGRDLSADQAAFLLEERLRPVGILDESPAPSGTPSSGGDKATAGVTRPDPLFLLRYRVPVIPERVVWHVAAPFRFLYATPVLLTMLAAFVGVEAWMIADGAIGEVAPSALALIDQPFLNLLVFAAILASGVFHECGHVTACRYGGARPGTMGVGLYLVWPAMYSTVTDTYRLGRGGRLRVDLGGVYFNVLTILVMDAAYLLTGSPWLLIAAVSMHVETMWQFLPSIRLDGYYILADLVGIPDLFSRFVPILRSLRPGPPDPRVSELKPWVRRTVGTWVALVIPCLAFWAVVFLLLAPRLIPAAWARTLELVTEVGGGAPSLGAGALAAGQLVLLLLPWVGGALIVQNLGRRAVDALGRRVPSLAGSLGRAAGRRALLLAALPTEMVPLLGRAGYLPAPTIGTALVLAGAVLVLGAVGDRLLVVPRRTRDWSPLTGWAAGLAVVVVVIGAAGPAAVPGDTPADTLALARWLEVSTDSAATVAVPADARDTLREAGVPASRIRADGALALVDAGGAPPDRVVARFGAWSVVGPPTDAATPPVVRGRQEAGVLLAQNPRLLAPPAVIDALQAGRVDTRVMVVLAALTSRWSVGVADVPTVAGETTAVPVHVLTVFDLDGDPVAIDASAAATLSGWIASTSPPIGPTTVVPRAAGMDLVWPLMPLV